MFTFRTHHCRPTRRTSVQFRPGVDELDARIAPSGFVACGMPALTQNDFMVNYTYPKMEVVASDDPLFCRVVML